MARLSIVEKRSAAPAEPVREARQLGALLTRIGKAEFRRTLDAARGAAMGARLDATDGDLDPERLIRLFGKWAGSITARNVDAWGKVLGFRMQEDAILAELFPGWIRQNFDLITSIQGTARMRARLAIDQAVQQGLRVEQNARQLQAVLGQQFSITRSRAMLIARDQTLTLNGQATRTYQRSAGVDEFEWLSSGDGRVREEHIALNGRIFFWNDPPSEGVPGEAILCRCTAYPVVRTIRSLLS
jgi:SPP1 gp7 family putative phage head morphogenesis protein